MQTEHKSAEKSKTAHVGRIRSSAARAAVQLRAESRDYTMFAGAPHAAVEPNHTTPHHTTPHALKPALRARRTETWRAAVGLVLLLSIFTMVLSAKARADVLATNLDTLLIYQDGYFLHGVEVSNNGWEGAPVGIAQKFSTGSNASGYTLSSVTICIIWYDPFLSVPKVSIYSAGTDGNPGASKYILTNPTLKDAGYGDEFTMCNPNGLNSFTAQSNAVLDADTDYFVVFENTGTQATETDTYSAYNIGKVLSGGEGLGASGWSLGDTEHRKNTPTSSWATNSTLPRPVRMKIEGTEGGLADTTAPSLSTATVDGTSLVLTYNEALDAGSEPATSAYSVSVAGGAGAALSSVDVTGSKVTLTLATAVTAGQTVTVTVTYTAPTSNPVQDTAGNDAGNLTNRSVTNNTNAPPVFANDSTTRSIDETVAATTVQTAADIGAAITATDNDNDTLTYRLEGTDAGKFAIVSTSGQIQTKVGESYDYETDTSYAVTVKASDGKGGSDTITVTINVTNDRTERPLIPAAPTVTATSGSTTSLNVRWTAPVNTGRPDITSYDLQYRKGASGSWSNGPQNQTGTSASITGLDANSMYQVRVLATNDDGDSAAWSSPGSGSTANNAPEFSSSSTTRTLAETVGDESVQTAANIGAAVTATDDDGDPLEYTLEGTDAGKFTIVSSSGQIRTKVGESYDREAKASYSVTVKASDGTTNDIISVTINITDATEKPLTPVAPSVTSTSGSTTSVDVTWTVPSNTGRPAITSYDLQYRKGTSGDWSDGPQNQTGTSATISGLDGNSLYQVQMRATNADGDSDWSSPGSGNTANNAPTFTNASTTRSIDETVGDATVQTAANIGAVVTATDPDNDTLTYTLEGTDAGKFTIVSSSGQIRTKVGESYDYETDTSYAVTVKAIDTDNGSAVSTVTINVTNNTTEKPLAPPAPTVVATSGVTMSLDVTWTVPSNTGRPAITSYDLQYRKGASGDWNDGPQNQTGTSASITGLDGNAQYQVQMRATNADGDGDWSDPGSGETANTPPVFADDSTTRSFAETLGDTSVQTAADIGAVVTATDPDDDLLTYSLEGTDAGKFAIDSVTGQIRTQVGESYNYEATTSYAVTIKADDSKGGTDTIAVTLIVTNVTEFDSAHVSVEGTHVLLGFIEDLSTTAPPISALVVTVDGEAATIQFVSAAGKIVKFSIVNRIRQGQTVTASYTDPTPGNDTNAIQDGLGNDAHSFTDEPVDNPSTVTPYRPRPPTGLTASADGSTRIDLSWTAPVDNGGRVITGYQIEWSPDGRTTGLNTIWNDVIANTNNSDRTYTVTGLSPGTSRYYRVKAINSEGTSEGSNVVTETTPTTDGAPSPPQQLSARDNGKTRINLSWTAPGYTGNSPVTGYKIEVSTDGGNNWDDLEADMGNTDTTYEHTGLSPSTTRHYRVFAINSVGTGLESEVVSATTTPRDTPNVPNNLRAVPGNGSVMLIWEAPDDDGGSPVTGYSFRLGYPNPDSGSTFQNWGPLLHRIEGTSFQRRIPGLHNGNGYIFEVRANNGNGPGAAMQVEVTLPVLRSGDGTGLTNTPPVVAIPLVDQTASVDMPFDYVIPEGSFTDADDDPLTYSAALSDGNALPLWLGFAPATGTFEGTPTPSDTGRVVVRVTASDGLATVSDDFSLTVPANTPPVVAIPLVDQTASVDMPFDYVIPEGSFTDADDDPLTYSAALSDGNALPLWLGFAPATGAFTGTPGLNDIGRVLVTVTASDGLASVSDEFALTVVMVDQSVLTSWLSRFGRTVGSHVTDAIGERVRGSRNSYVTLAGHQFTLGGTDTREPLDDMSHEAELTDELGLDDVRSGYSLHDDSDKGTNSGLWAEGERPDSGEDQDQTLNDLRGLLAGSSFQLALNPNDTPTSSRLTAWGRVAGTRFDGHDGDLSLDGDVLTATLGVDRVSGKWLAGVAVAHSQGDGGYSMEDARLRGDLENDLTSIHPYLRYAVSDSLDVWGVLGYGWGELSVEHEIGGTLKTDTNLSMAAFGARGILLAASELEGLELATRTELMFTRMTSEKIPELPSTVGDAHRLRVILEGSRAFIWADSQQLTPSIELGLRNDWGSAESGFGLELGGRVNYANPASRLTLEGAIRGLLVHEADHYREWGASGALRLEPEASGRGLSLALVSNWGAAGSGVEGVWARQAMTGLVPDDRTHASHGSLEVQLGYGLWIPAIEGLVTPFTQVTASNAGESRLRIGLMFYRRNSWVGPVRAELAGERIKSDAGQLEHRIGLQIQLQLGRSSSPAQVERGHRRTRLRGK